MWPAVISDPLISLGRKHIHRKKCRLDYCILQTDRTKAGTDKIKSQRGGSVDVFVSKRVKWPHEYVLACQNKDQISYNQLSPIQWMAGFCRSIKEEPDSKIKEHMLDYGINLLEDATDFSWSSAKASHAVLLCHMEQGEVGIQLVEH